MKVKLKIKIKSKHFDYESNSIIYRSENNTEYYSLGSILKSKAA